VPEDAPKQTTKKVTSPTLNKMAHILAVSDWRSQPIDDLYTILVRV